MRSSSGASTFLAPGHHREPAGDRSGPIIDPRLPLERGIPVQLIKSMPSILDRVSMIASSDTVTLRCIKS
jgi:hypothetical protein